MPEDELARLVDVPALQRYIDERLPGPASPITVRKHTAGYSNVTLFIDRGEDRWVMRRPPLGHLLPTAHDVMREWRFISAVHGNARVARPVLSCEDPSVIGAPFYIMERVPGTEIRETIPGAYDTPAGRRRMAEEMIDALVEVHAVDWQAAGLTAPRGSYVDRQLARWQQQWELTRPRTRDLPGLDRVSHWLEAHKPPEGEQTIAHGDFKIDNVLFSLEEPRLLAILDWELATIGDPLSDVGWLMSSWGDPGASPTAIDSRDVLPQPVTVLEGFPDRDELAQMYAGRSGRTVHDIRFYLILAIFKGALIGEGIYMRWLEGNVTNPLGARMEWQVPLRVERMLALIEE
ncbi:MAG TPA: phosphotransferase family protein [Tepidiformaceae bacterium]|nr:phosphotransferase family protein [Tepidiformaceae bacterium]